MSDIHPTDLQSFFRAEPKGFYISEVKPLKTFINEYPNEQLLGSLTLLEQQYPFYRAVYGDGNCFYRAVMFLYLQSAQFNHFEHLFPEADLFKCTNLPFRNPKRFTSVTLLRYIWERYLLPLSDLSPSERVEQLQRVINSSLVLDAVLVAYFRSLNHGCLLARKNELSSYVVEDFGQILSRVITFGQQSEGIQLYSLAQVLQAQITILMVLKDGYKKTVFKQNRRNNYIVSYRPGHYDIPVQHQTIKSSFLPSNPRYTPYHQARVYDKSSRKVSSCKVQTISIRSPLDLHRLTQPNIISESKQSLGGKRKEEGSKIMSNLSSFKQYVDRKSHIKKQSFSISGLEERTSQSKNVTKIRSSSISNQPRQKQQKIVGESIMCIGLVLLLLMGLFVTV